MHIETRGAGPDLVLLHGWAMHAGIFAPLLPALAARCTLHLVDLPGHGRSVASAAQQAASPPPFALQPVARELLRQLPRAVWLGWSLGGLVALTAALQQPSAVRGLALIATNPRFVLGDDWPHGVEHEIFAQFGRDLARDYRGTLDRFIALECHGSDCARAELRELRAHVFDHGQPAAQVLADGLAILADTDLRTQLPRLAMPARWIAGARDRLVPAAAMQWAAQAMPHGRFVAIKGGGHAPFIGHPERVLPELHALLDEVLA